MKKKLLLGSVVLAALSAFSQNGRIKPQAASMVDMAGRLASKYELINNPVERSHDLSKPIGPVFQAERTSSVIVNNWMPLSGSMNVYGVLVSNSRPLQYNKSLDVVSFVHRKSFTYVASPVPTPSGAATGAIVGQIMKGINSNVWDSTLIWNNNSSWARFPTGGIYSAPGNTLLSNAYIIASGPITQANTSYGWVGNYLASKKLDVFNNVASTVQNAQQFIPNTPVFGVSGKFDFARADFTATDDGAIRVIGGIFHNANGTTATSQGFRGARILNGTFSSGVFSWQGDSIIPPFATTSGGSPQIISQPHMAFNDAGTIGYVWFIGCRTGATGANSGFQPIVYKTTNAGATWSPMPGINFNTPTFSTAVLDHLAGVSTNSNLSIPFFDVSEDVDGLVDMNGNLHIVSTIISTFSNDPDSLGFTSQFTNADGEKYSCRHHAGSRPYIYDFTSSSNGTWNVTVIDSMSSEAPGEQSGREGYSSNPWDPAGGTNGTDKVSSNARIQASRTADGRYIVYTWAESDTNFTSSQLKWNNIPNIKARSMDVSIGLLSPTEINVTSNASGGSNPYVASHAQMYYSSPKCVLSSTTTSNYVITLPMTVTNNQNTPMTQLLPNTHWYSSASLAFTSTIVSIAENTLNSLKNSVLYPNPALGSAKLQINLTDNSGLDLQVINLVGDVVKSTHFEAQAGNNTLDVDLAGLSSGIYMVNVKVGNVSSTKKLIVE